MRRKTKYGNTKVIVDGIKFDSKRESRRYLDLKLLERAGEIENLQLQVPILMQGQLGPIKTPTGRQARYVADFTYTETKTGLFVVEDSKGMRTDVYLLKKAILAAMGIEIRES